MIDHLIRTDVHPVDKRAEVREVYGFIRGAGGGVPVIMDRGRPYGVLNVRGLVKSHIGIREKIDGRGVTGTRLLRPQSRVEEALDVLAESKLRYVPVVDGERLLGVVDAVDVLHEVESGLTAGEAAREVPLLRGKETVGQALHWFHEVPAAVLPVVDEDGRLAGAVHRAALFAMETDQRPEGRSPASGDTLSRLDVLLEGFVEQDVPRLPPGASYREVLDRLKRFGHAFVVGAGEKPLGVVTPEELAYLVSRKGRQRAR